MQILISSVKIPDRVRKDLGDVQSLMDSLQRCGQLNPITVSRDMELIAGHRRFEAASRLGWRMIDATVVDGINEVRRLEIELEENIHRKDFSPEELLDGVRRLDDLRHPRPLKKLGKALRKVVGALAFWRYFGKRKTKSDLAMGETESDAESGEVIGLKEVALKKADAGGAPRKPVPPAAAKFRVAPADVSDDEALGI